MRMMVSAPPSENYFPVSEVESLSTVADEVAIATCRAAKNPENSGIRSFILFRTEERDLMFYAFYFFLFRILYLNNSTFYCYT